MIHDNQPITINHGLLAYIFLQCYYGITSKDVNMLFSEQPHTALEKCALAFHAYKTHWLQ